MYRLTHVYQGLQIVFLSRNFRLESHDRYKNFREDPIIIPEPLNVFWPITGFEQLRPEHNPMPQLTYHQIEQYFLSRMAEGKQMTSDLKALEKGKDHLTGERIFECSIS